ncbi:MAG: ankyrin repeat domain-containing protein [Candidatus Babeliales bacterium]
MVNHSFFIKAFLSFIFCIFSTSIIFAMGGWIDLFNAIMCEDASQVSTLIAQGSNINVQDEGGWTPLMLAVANGNIEIVNQLLRTGKADIDAKNSNGFDALLLANPSDHTDIIKLLINAGANVERPRKGIPISLRFANEPEISRLISEKLDESYAQIRCKYRNLIIIIDDGSEWKATEAKGQGLLGAFVTALVEECAFILIPTEVWDYFLHAHYMQENSIIDTKELFNQVKNRWEIYKIHTQTESAQENFYIFCPKKYKRLLTTDPNRPSIRFKKFLSDIDATCLDLGISILDKESLDKPGELGNLIETVDSYKKQLEELETQQATSASLLLKKQKDSLALQIAEVEQQLKINAYLEKSGPIIYKNFIQCLDKLLVFKKANQKLVAVGCAAKLPQYNVYIIGHGGSTEPSSKLETLVARWFSGGFAASEEIKQLKKEVRPQLIEQGGHIAGLPANIFGQTLESFNNITNSFFVTTCHGGGLHLILPFVFMSSPVSLSYTLINTALLDVPIKISGVFIKGDIGNYTFEPFTLFQDFFDGISDFHHFAKNKADTKNCFSQLLNYVGNFLGSNGKLSNVSNVPWIKLPGPTDWHTVSYIDDQVLVINDVMMRAKAFEKKYSTKPSAKALKSRAETPESAFALPKGIQAPKITKSQKMTAEEQKAWKENWGKWEEARKSPAKSSEVIDATQKKFIFVQTNNVPLTIKFGHTIGTKAIIPTMKTTGFSNIMIFDAITSDDTFADFFNNVLKSKAPLVKTPDRTVIFIKTLTCLDITYSNFMLPFAIPELAELGDYDFYYSIGRVTYGQKVGSAPTKVSFDTVLYAAVADKKAWLIDLLLKIGANPNAKDPLGNTALMKAAQENEIEIVRLLIAAPANLNEKDKSNSTALMLAAQNGSIEIVRLLLQVGGDAIMLPDPAFIRSIVKTSEIRNLLMAVVTRRSPIVKKELKILQRNVTHDAWDQIHTGGKPIVNKIITPYLSRFSAMIQKQIEA